MAEVQKQIRSKLITAFNPQHLEVINESDKHNVPPGSESHFKVVIVTPNFSGRSLLERHRKINELLAEELAGKIHALSLQPLTPDEWQARGGKVAATPPCAKK